MNNSFFMHFMYFMQKNRLSSASERKVEEGIYMRMNA